MASTSPTTSTASGSSSAKTPAQLMQEQHEAAESHRATVEDVADEDDIGHPSSATAPSADSQGAADTGLMSVKAAGKQKAAEKQSVIDTHSEEAFPSLGSANKSAAPASAARAPGWVANAAARSGPNGNSMTPRPASGARTPVSVPGTPTSVRPGGVGGVSIPGKHRDSFEIDNSDLDKSKPLKRILDDVKKKFGVVVTTRSSNFASRTQFVAEGPKARVTEALMYISKELTLEKQVKIEIPSAVSPQIIGRAGSNIKQLESQFSVRIKIDRDSRPATGADDIRTDTVEIKGHAAGVRQVEAKIMNQVKQLQPKIDMPVRGIPPEFYPFLAGRHSSDIRKLEQDHDLQIQIPQFHTWQQQPPPRMSDPAVPPTFVPHGDSHIILSGEQAAAAQARATIERLVAQLQKELILEELACEQILHPYIVGERGMDPLQFMEETGCAVIIPPSHHETEDVHIIGPRDRLEAGRNLAESLMSKKHNRTVDLQKQFSDAPMGAERHSRALAQYLQQRAIESEFMKTHDAEIVFPANLSQTPTWNIVTSDSQKAMSARNELAKITQAFPPSRLNLIEIDPFFHPHLEDLHSQSLRDTHGVHMIVPEDGEDLVVLVFEGPTQDGPFNIPRTKPSKNEIAEFERALQQAQAQIMSSIPHQGISVQELPVPRKYQDKVHRFVKSEPNPQTPKSFPVQVAFNAPKAARSQVNGGPAGSSADTMYLRGPNEKDLADLRQRVEQFLKEAEADEKERGYTLTFDFPAQFTKNLIGKQGANIKALREKHDVEIDSREQGKIKIQGPQKKAEAAKAEILKLGKAWEDEVNYTIKIDPKFHGMLVGRNGENLQKIQSKVNNDVRIDFPRVSRAADDASAADNASEAGGARSAQASDEIKIRGPRAKADKVRDELLSLHQYLLDTSYTATVSVAQDQIASLIGKRGAEMEKLRAETGAQIEVPKNDGSDRVTITLKGTKQQVEKAKLELQKRSKEFDAVVTHNIDVDRKYHRALIGSGGSNIQSIVSKAGGTGSSAEHVRFPRAGEESDQLVIKGSSEVADAIRKAIQDFVEERENQVSDTIDVPLNQHRELIGPNGSIRKKLEDDFSVGLNVPRQGSNQTAVKVTGRRENVEKVKAHIGKMLAKPEGETMMIPRNLHHAVSKNGALFRELAREGVRIDHSGQKPPGRAKEDATPRARATPGKMPLITDEASSEAYSWDIVSSQEAKGESGEIPWVISANNDAAAGAVEKAKTKISGLLQKASEPRHTGYLILPDPRFHRHIIGQGGSTINSIRKQSGCDIQVPNKNTGKGEEGEAITIVGQEDGVLLARDMILKEIKNADAGGRGSPRVR